MATDSTVTVRAAVPADLDRVRQLLAASSLPLEGVPASLSGYAVAEEAGTILGVAGVEDCGEYGLLRSAAVDPDARNRGIGKKLVERLIDDAKHSGRKTLYLLTTTAKGYFPSFGFAETPRDDLPPAIRATEQFTTSCPSSATVMKLDLQ